MRLLAFLIISLYFKIFVLYTHSNKIGFKNEIK